MDGSLNGKLIKGFVSFQQNSIKDPIKITVNLTGLPTRRGINKHGLHIHLNSIKSNSDDVAERCDSTGPHFNPSNQSHGDILAARKHAGDYGNVISDNYGNIFAIFTDHTNKLYGESGIVGRSVVLHEKEDDLGSIANVNSLSTGKFRIFFAEIS